MGKKALLIVSVLVLAIGGLLVAAPTVGHADPIRITDVSVTVGDITYCGKSSTSGATCSNVGNSHDLWSSFFGTTGVVLPAGGSLVLTQVGGFNFDSSEGHTAAGATSCLSPTRPCATSITIDTVTNSSSNTTLANFNADDGTGTHNEAADWSTAAGVALVGGFGQVYFGYADNAHSGACTGADTNGNCFPNVGTTKPLNIFDGVNGGSVAPTFFFGSGGTFATCSHGATAGQCYDAGAILIYNTQAVPEPITMFLGGTGLLALAYAARKRLFGRQQLA
jgi:hypothetical protein